MGREVYPGLSGAKARGRIAKEVAADEALAAAVDEAALKRGLAPAKLKVLAAAAQAENRRVADLIRRDRALRIEDAMRDAATYAVEDGRVVATADTVLPPTPEWMQQHAGEIIPFTPRLPDGTVRTSSTVRRMQVPVITRMERKGQLSREAAGACRRYADTYEAAGLDGNIPSVNLGREVFSAPATRSMFTDAQGEAQSELRLMRAVIPAKLRRFFDAVVLKDVPVHRAANHARMRRSAAVWTFRELAEAVADVVEKF